MLTTARRQQREEMWKFTNQPIHQPLLQKLIVDESASRKACDAFLAILKYMGDLPVAKPKSVTEFTDEIFSGALENDLLKDEIYCQIMRQLTYNRLLRSEESGWDLLCLATGLFAPSAGLAAELQKFLKSRTHPLVESCLKRLEKTQKVRRKNVY